MTATAKDEPIVYRQVGCVDIRTLPLGPEEAFVLSRVDGKSTSAAIAGATGLDRARVETHLRRLAELGVLKSTASSSPAPKHGAARSATTQSGAGPLPASAADKRIRSVETGSTMSRERAEALAGRHCHELDESLDISVGRQATIIDLSSRLPHITHFEVLGVPRDAARADIKRAYFSVVGAYHPDKYFGKNLGNLRRRMEQVFQRMTEAHDVLTNRLARAEYEAYLQARGRTGSGDPGSEPDAFEDLERLLSQAERQSRDRPQDDAAAVASDAAASGEGADRVSRRVPPPLPPRDSRPPAPSIKPPPLPTGSLPPEPVRMVDDPAARRQALARKLGLAPPPTPSAEDKEQAQRAQSLRQRAVAKDLRDRYQHRKTDISDQRVGRYIAAVEESLAAGNPVSALNAVKIAHSFIEPGTSLAGRLQQLETQASALLADSYLERARYEETNGHYEEAARSYTRSARGRPSSDVLRSAAECYLKAGTDLRQAGELAREAVQIAPKRADLRMTLAKVYETAGMAQSAVKELTRALEIAPENDRIKQWLKRLQRGGV